MGEERWQTISLKLSEEALGKLKAYAEVKGQSVSDVVRQAIEELLGKEGAPSPGPSPAPGFGELEERLRRQIKDVQATVNEIMALLTSYLPPPPP